MYVELHAHSFFSLLEGVPSPEALVQRAAALDMPAIALTDQDALYGAVRFAQAAEAAGIKPIFGAELTLTNGGGHITLLAENDTGYANLCRLITLGRRDQEKGFASLPWRYLAEHAGGLIALCGSRNSEIARAILNRDKDKARHVAERYAAIFGRRNFFLELQRHYERGDNRLNTGLINLSEQLGVPLIATSNAYYLAPENAHLNDVLTCIRHRVSLHQAGALLRTNTRYYLHSPAEMDELFADWPTALQATLEVAERCNARLPTGPQAFPILSSPEGLSSLSYLRRLCEEGLARRLDRQSKLSEYRALLDHELEVIAEQGLVNYFLVVHDLVQFARSRGILCQGRGSAANSLTAFSLGITPIDPISSGLVFERFLSRERAAPPDIDLDFAADRREEAIQYLYKKYGHDHVAMACTYSTFGAKQAIRDVGKVLDFPQEILDRMSDSIDSHAASDLLISTTLRAVFGDKLDTPRWKQLISFAAEIDSFPRHLGLHNGGMVISARKLIEQIPVEPAAMEDRFVTQWDKDALEAAGWIKLDVLGLRMLSAISDACDLITLHSGQRPDLSSLRFDDQKVYEMISRRETVGVFQVESRAQMDLIPRFRPKSLADLTVQIALIRPGPIQANAVHPYLRRRAKTESVTYLHPLLKPAVQETLGVLLFQEQVLRLAHDVAGFSLGEGELLRRALGHKRADQEIDRFHDRFIAGAISKGVPKKTAEQIFDQVKAFGHYSFSKAHAAAFAVLTYWSAWLRCYYPLEFFIGILRNEPMGFYEPHVVVSDAQRIGVKFLPVDVNYSQARASLEGDCIRLGFDYVHGFGPEHIEVLLAERQRAPFSSLIDLVKRTQFDRRHVEALILAGSLDGLGERRQLLWDLAEAFHLARRPQGLSLRSPDEHVKLPPMSASDRLSTAFAFTGVSLEGHLTTLRRDAFTRLGARPIRDLPRMKHGQRVKVGGLVIARQRPPTAKGVAFLTLEDPDGFIDVVVPPPVYEKYREVLRRAFVIVDGILQKDRGAMSVVAREVIEV